MSAHGHIYRKHSDGLISAEDLASLEATVELLSDTEAMARVREAERDIESGNFTTGAEMDELMRKRGGAAATRG